MKHRTEEPPPSPADLLEQFGGPDVDTVDPRTLQEHRAAVSTHTGISGIPYTRSALAAWLNAGGRARVLEGLVEAVEDGGP